jgi:hypothetical protein
VKAGVVLGAITLLGTVADLIWERWNAHGVVDITEQLSPGARPGVRFRPHSGPLLFLDIDGVLHPGTSGSLIHLPRFKSVALSYSDLGIVISSTWRESWQPDQLLALFSLELHTQVVGITPVLADKTRYDESCAYCVQAGAVKWLAIDGRGDQFSVGCRNLFLTSVDTGLDATAAAALRARLFALTEADDLAGSQDGLSA